MLTIRGVTKTFTSQRVAVSALRGVDLMVRDGSFTAILGASGCGKTTLLRVIGGFERADSGEIHLGDYVLAANNHHVPPERRGIGVVPQEGALFPHLSVAQNVGFGLRHSWRNALSARARRQHADRIDEMLEMVGLRTYGQRRPDELSGGQQQRVALARALAPDPKVLLLDEPFSALDAGLRAELREEVRALLQRLGTTTVLVTHDQEEALSLADHVAIMRDGKVVQANSPQELYTSPGDSAIAEFLGEAVLLPGRMVAGQEPDLPCVECDLGCIVVRSADDWEALARECIVMLRPEQLEITEGGTPARVVSTSFFGHDGIVRVRLGINGTGAEVLVRILGNSLPPTGALVGVRVADGVAACILAPTVRSESLPLSTSMPTRI